MATVPISVYIPDDKFVKFLEKKREIMAEVKQLVKEKLEEGDGKNG